MTLKRITVLIVFVLALTGCEAVGLGGAPAPASDSGSAIQNPIAAPQNPRDVVSAFLNAWSAKDYDSMYALLSSQSQQLTSQPVFRQFYLDADTQVVIDSLRHRISSVREQGDSVAVHYDLTIVSPLFGEIEDPGRTMRLVRAPAGWRIAWTTMDIFSGYAAGASLVATSRRPTRGNIYDRDGDLIVEQDATVVELYIMRNEIRDEPACLDLLAMLLRRQRSDLQTFFARFDPGTIFGFGDLDPDVFAFYNQQLSDVCAIRSDTRVTRRYVGHGTSAHITGYIGQISVEEQESYLARGYTTSDLIGKTGIEAIWEEELAGTPTRILQIIEPGGLVVRELGGAEGSPAQSVTLTIDDRLQAAAAQALADAFNYAEPNWGNRAHATGGGIVALDINSGAVLALASFPSFDPGIFNPDTGVWLVGDYIISLTNDVRQPFINRVTQQQYPPGSVFKIVTTAAAAAENVWRPGEIFNCERVWNGRGFGDTREERYDWRNFEPEEANFDTGEVTISGALTASCNPFYYQMGALLFTERGPDVLNSYARQMGLGRATGIDLNPPPEASGQIVNPRGVDAAISNAIGQNDTQVSIIQMARLVAGIANGGTLYQPYIVQRVGPEDGDPTYVAEPRVVGEMGLSQQVLDIVRRGMCDVTDSTVYGATSGQRLGTAWFVFSDPDYYPAPFTVCGKTGTAQTGRTEPMGWFVAYAPADNPQIAVAAMIEYSREGSETAAPIVRRLLETYFDVPPQQVAPYPQWWRGEYVPLNIPEGSTGV